MSGGVDRDLLIRHLSRGERSDDEIRQVVELLRNMFGSILRRRGLLDCPPGFVGYSNHVQWNVEALMEAACDLYEFVFEKRLLSLREKAEKRPDEVVPTLWVIIRNFVTDGQRRADPIGWDVFQNVRQAARDLLDTRQIRIDPIDRPKIDNGTVLLLDDDARVAEAVKPGALEEALRETECWRNIAGLARKSATAQMEIANALLQLRELGVTAVRFKDLADVLKSEARASAGASSNGIAAAFDDTRDTDSVWGLLGNPLEDLEETDAFRRLTARVLEDISSLDSQKRLIEKVEAIFRELVARIQDGQSRPSQAEIGRLLDLPRSTVSECFGILQALLTAAKNAVGGGGKR